MSEILKTVHDTAKALHDCGAMSDAAMQKFNELCSAPDINEIASASMSLIVIRCSSIELSKVFYEKLGFIFVKEKHGNGPWHYSTSIGNLVFEIYPLAKNGIPCNTRLGFSLNSINEKIKHFDVTGEYNFQGKHVFIVIDPDGRKIELS